MNDLDLWPLIWETLDALTAHYGPDIDRAAEALGIPAGEWYGWLMAARIFEPEPVSARTLHVRSAYTAPAKLDFALAEGAELGLLVREDGENYRLTAAGRAAVQHLIETAYGAMNSFAPCPRAICCTSRTCCSGWTRPAWLRRNPRASGACESQGISTPAWRAPVMERLDQYLSDLAAYRDDAHLAAWQPYEISGQAWEAFTLLWRGAATTLDELCEKLVQRRGLYPGRLCRGPARPRHAWMDHARQ